MTTLQSFIKNNAIFVVSVMFTLVLAGWIRFHVLDIYEDNRGLLEVSSRTQAAMAEARKILRGQGTGVLFGGENSGGYNADDTGFAIYIAGVWKIFGDQNLNSLQSATVWLDLLGLLFLMMAMSRTFNKATAILTGVLYALYLPIPIQIAYSNNHVLVVQFAVLLVSLVLLFPKHLIGQLVLTTLAALLFLFANTVRSVFGPFGILIGFFLFLKYGKKRGLLIGLIFIGLILVGNLCLKVAMGNPSHQVWHSLYVGLGEFPNPYGLTGLDTEGNDEAGRVQPGVDMYQTTQEYMEVIKHRALVLIDEDRGFYLKALLQRAFKVLVGFQDWYFIGFGPEEQTADTIAWILFLVGWAGIVLSFLWKKWDAFLLFMGYLYFSLCIVPLLATHSAYYIAGSVMLLPFAAYLVASLRLMGHSVETVKEEIEWDSDFTISKWVFGFIFIGLLLSMIGTAGFLAYAHKDSEGWKQGFLVKVNGSDPLGTWEGGSLEAITSDSKSPTLAAETKDPNTPHLFQVFIDVQKGRLGLELRDAQGQQIAPPTFTAGIGMNQCFLGWTPQSAGEVRLHIWETVPREYPNHHDKNDGPFFYQSFKHCGLVDYAKLEFFPGNRLEVSASFFPNGHEAIPYRLKKERPSTNEASSIPNYWAAGVPCWTQVDFETPRRINRVICQLPNQRIAIDPPYLQLKHKNQKVFRAPMTLKREVHHEGREVQFRFSELEVTAVQIKFDKAGNDLGIAYLQDVSIPEPAQFELETIHLYRGDEKSVYPTSLSFISEIGTHP